MLSKRKVATLVAEFLGTGILTLLVLSVQRSTIGIPFFVSMIAALTMVVLVFALASTSGAILNPAIAISLWTARKLSTLTTLVYVGAELLGAWGAYYLYGYYINNHLTPVGGKYATRILIGEAVGAAILGFAWGAVAYKKWSVNLKAPVIGIATMVGMVAASTVGLGLINPGLALGVRAWVWGTYVLGPVLGAVVGFNLYGQLFATDKELAQAKKEAVPFISSLQMATTSSSSSVSSRASVGSKKKVSAKKKSTKRK